ncbi:hypothetical protein [Kineosporia succinea]|uniref:Uncharacterized protein n=1 Tax=Kineosporia succinea TaxID=84632 RepID=A0ABT9P5W5_9ACTN|nr:hypothetical protein [Kineosporia succinea]MDP9828078.1 hypothetical protein [Kineosporia succinea]
MSAVIRALRSYRRLRKLHGATTTDAVEIVTTVLAEDRWSTDAEVGAAVRALIAEKRVDDATADARWRFHMIKFAEEQTELRRRFAA